MMLEKVQKEVMALPRYPESGTATGAENNGENVENTNRVRLVAGYARVSTDKEEQLSSYEAQKVYYEQMILEHEDWEYVGLYSDEGISGTSIKGRSGFKRMITDALAGKIDLIVTKSISRFARNTVDSLMTIRALRERNIEVFFEKENIFTLDSKGELLITIMSSLAQEESRSISQNVSWGIQRMHAQGRTTIPFSEFLGYRRGPDGWLEIDPEQAPTVRRIFELYLEGQTPYGIAGQLMAEGRPSPVGLRRWYGKTVQSILGNEKYMGDLLIQKTYVKDFLTKEKVINHGEVQQYYVKNDHPAIISREVFERVQEELRTRDRTPHRPIGAAPFFGKVKCGECGGTYGRKVWHPGTKREREMWVCNRKYRHRKNRPATHCKTPNLTTEELEAALKKEGLTDGAGDLKFDQILSVTVFSRDHIEVLF